MQGKVWEYAGNQDEQRANPEEKLYEKPYGSLPSHNPVKKHLVGLEHTCKMKGKDIKH